MSLDPQNWTEFRELAHRALDFAIDHLSTLRDRPVWQSPPERPGTRPPHAAQPLAEVLQQFETTILPYASGNLHPGFMGWVQGAGTPVGVVAEMLAATMNANCGGRHHAAIEVEREIAGGMSRMFGFPDAARGLFTTGASQANLLAVLIARTRSLGAASRLAGLGHDGGRLRAYASREVHACVARAMDIAGLGTDALRVIDVDAAYRIRLDALRAAIASDRSAGWIPFMVIGNAGSVNTGSIDPLADMAALAKAEDLYFHVDAALGAFAVTAGALAAKFRGIEQADSIAFDFHKWAHVPYDAGFLLSRSAAVHDAAFASSASYLSRAQRGLASGDWWPTDSGPDLSRGFRALKAWFTLKVHGLDAIGREIQSNCDCAAHLAARISREPALRVEAPVDLNIVCFGFTSPDRGDRNRRVVEMLHEDGRFAPSTTQLDGTCVIRAAILNHRTTLQDMDDFVDRLLEIDGRPPAQGAGM